MLNRLSDASAGQQIAPQVPHNIEAEQALLGSLLVANESYDRVSDFLAEVHFYDPLHGRIFAAIARQLAEDKRVTPVSLKAFFDGEPPIGQVTVSQYLGRLASCATSTINARDYGQTIKQLYLLRELTLIGEDMAATARQPQVDYGAEAQIHDAEARLFAMAEHGTADSEVSIGEAVYEAARLILLPVEEKRRFVGLSTGFRALDEILGGLKGGDLLLLAGRPSQGKTSLALNIALSVAASATPVAFFSLEMSTRQLANRALSQRVKISVPSLLSQGYVDEQAGLISEAAHGFRNLPITLDGASGASMSRLALKARKLVRTKGVKLILVDYVGLIQPDGRSGSRNDDIAAISSGLKALARDLDVPVIALSQLSRQLENRADKRPQLADLRDSGALEQDADVVMFVFREEWYLRRDKPPMDPPSEWIIWNDKLRTAEGKAEVIVAKHRNGECGTAHMRFDGALTLFLDSALTALGLGLRGANEGQLP